MGKDVANHKDRPTTRMKGSISMAKNDYDTMPMHTYLDNLSPRYRNYGKSREATRNAELQKVSSREIDSRGLSPRGPHHGIAPLQLASSRMLNSSGSAHHPTVISQNAP